MSSHEISGALAVLWFATICFGLPVLLAGLADAVDAAIAKRRKESRRMEKSHEAPRTWTES